MASRVPNNRTPVISPQTPTYAGARGMTRRQLYDHIQAFQRVAPKVATVTGTAVVTAIVPVSAGTAPSSSTSTGPSPSNYAPQPVAAGGAADAGSGTPYSRFDHVHALNVFGAAGASHTSGAVPDPGSTAHSPVYWLGSDSSWHAMTAIVQLGTVTVGVWNGTAIAAANGGTGQTSYTDGQLLIGDSSTGGLDKATLTQGLGISITNAHGAITIATNGVGLSVHPSCQWATTAALPTNTYNNGASGVGATLTAALAGVLAVDSGSPALGDRILVQDEATGANNGIYTLTTLGTVAVAYVLTRATDMNTSTEFAGAFTFIEEGTVNTGAGFVCTNSTAPTVGTTAIAFEQFSGLGEISVTLPLTKSGNTLAINAATTSAVGVAQLATPSSDTTAGHVVQASDTRIAPFVASGAGHLPGIVPDPGGSSGTARYLREDATWATPPGSVPSTTFAVWSSSVAYVAGNVVLGSDGNLYYAQTSTTNNNPTADTGTNWKLWALQASITLNCGVGQTFADAFAASSSAGGAMTPGLNTAIAFIASAVGAVSPSVATIVLQQANNPTFTSSAAGSATTIKTTTNIPIGASLELKSVGSGGTISVGKTTTVTGSSFSSGTYTLTVGSMTNASVSGDVFIYAPYYGTNSISINLPIVGANLTIQGSTSTPACPTFYPSLTTQASGGFSGPCYAGVTYTWTDAAGVTQETMPGPVTSISASANKITCAGFTLPTGTSGANLYIANNGSSGSTLVKQGAFVITAGVAANLQVTSVLAVTNAPTSNPAPATYPCAVMFGAAAGISFSGCKGTVTGLYLYGATTAQAVLANTGAQVTVTGPLVASNFNTNLTALNNSSLTITGTQSDAGASFNLYASIGSFISASTTVAPRAGSVGVAIYNRSYGSVTGVFVGYSSFGFSAFYGGQAVTTPANPAGGTAVPTYGNTTQATPAFNSFGSASSSQASSILYND